MKNLFLFVLPLIFLSSCLQTEVVDSVNHEKELSIAVSTADISNHSFGCMCPSCQSETPVKTASFSFVSESEPVDELPDDIPGWINWAALLAIALIEIITRFIPAAANWTPLTIIENILNAVVPNKTKRGKLVLKEEKDE